MTTRSYGDVFEEIRREYAKPSDLENSELILGQEVEPFIFAQLSGCEKDAYSLKALHVGLNNKFLPKASNFRYEDDGEIIWDVDHSLRGSFTQEGRFVLEKDTENVQETMWFVQTKKKQIRGPFTLFEMKEKMKKSELDHAMIKRDKDAVFISFRDVQKRCPGVFGDMDKIDEMFSTMETKLENKDFRKIGVAIKPDPGSFVKSTRKIGSQEVEDSIENSTKSKAFLLRKRSKASLRDVVKKAEGHSKAMCLKIISEATGMGKFDCEAFLDIFVAESKLPLCCDVDDEGFEAASPISKACPI